MLTKTVDIRTALEQGYRFILQGDGVADVIKSDGQTYGVDLACGERGVCTCPDFQIRGGSHHGACKHMWWIGQVTTCDYCGAVMVLIGEVFECVNAACSAAKSLALVKAGRAQRRAEHKHVA